MKSYALVLVLSSSLPACTSARKESFPPSAKVKAAAAAPAAPTDRQDALRSRDVDFVATGNEPFWSLEINSRAQMRFRTAAGDSLLMPLPTPNQAQDAPVLRYRAQTEAGELTVTIAQRPCPNSMSGEVLPYTVAVQAKTSAQTAMRDFAGCGRYLGDYRLHDIWALETVDGQAVVATQFGKDKPYLELNLTSGQVLGFSGCNAFGGNLTPERGGIRFGTLRGTMLACPALAFEQKFRGALSGQSFIYRLENRRLTLENRANTLIFKKID